MSVFLVYGTVVFFVLSGSILHGEVVDDIKVKLEAFLDYTIKIFKDPLLSAEAKRALLEQELRENLDFGYMTAHTLGPQIKAFTKEEFALFSQEFSRHLIHLYLLRISHSEGDSFKVQNVKLVDDSSDVMVRSFGVLRHSPFEPRHVRTRAQVDFRLRKRGDGWRIISISLDGVNVSRNFRHQFKRMLSKDEPMVLIEALRKRNTENDLKNPFLKKSK